ncbi:glycerol-3-phosphate 1-O-acyltransferase PlsB [Isoalcanivorax indicus]|uniref:glycerol-3-phosphate 1-O-acyltransferase PlsB n=1 Tax=Isoalcanivorax indicus TaxID=2202653 RepID=UPI000DB9AA14|nr:glycerol-3-phosphate 1-O-acyltransferase PlsB [Isoalcanivorax indicus]
MTFWFGLDRLFFFIARLFLTWCTRVTCFPRDISELELDATRPILYVLRDASVADMLLLDRETRRMGLPSPLDNLALPGHTLRRSYYSLYRRNNLVGRERVSPPPRRLLRAVEHLAEYVDEDVQIVPVALFWGRRPEKENSLWKIMFADNWSPPGFIKKFFIILTQGRQLFMNISAPISLRQLVDQPADVERTVRKTQRILRVHFRRQREAMIGPDLSHRRTLVNTLLDSAPVREVIRKAADEAGEPYEKHEAHARRYAMEIAADYSHTVIRFLEVVLEWVWNRLYSGLRAYNMDTLQRIARDHEVIYVPCHRSHADYLLLSYLVYKHGLVPPHIAAGINLNLPVIGTILRRGGAFFMRRSFKGNPVYAAVFNEYMHIILSRGYSIEYFVEGGRSRSGRMLKPRPGMLAMTVQSFLRDHSRPIALVPVYIGYEKLIEGSTYIGEMHGQKKEKESIFGFLKSLSVLRKHFGEVHVNFGDPIKLGSFLDEQTPGWRRIDLKQPLPDSIKQTVDALGTEVVTRINAAAVANPVNLLSLALLATPKHTMDEVQLGRQLALYAHLLGEAPYSRSAMLARSEPGEIIQYGMDNHFIHRIEHAMGDLISTDPVTALQMAYIRNNSLHLFVLPGLVCSLLGDGRDIPQRHLQRLVRLLYPFFRSEYFLHWREDGELDQAVEQILRVLADQGLILREGDMVRSAPLHTLESDLLAHLGQTVAQALERYYLTIRILVQHGNARLDAETLEELAHLTAQRLSLLYEFNSPEFFDRAVLRNFIHQLQVYKLVERDDHGMLCFDDRLQAMDDEARRILSPDLRQGIVRLTRLCEARQQAAQTQAGNTP